MRGCRHDDDRSDLQKLPVPVTMLIDVKNITRILPQERMVDDLVYKEPEYWFMTLDNQSGWMEYKFVAMLVCHGWLA